MARASAALPDDGPADPFPPLREATCPRSRPHRSGLAGRESQGLTQDVRVLPGELSRNSCQLFPFGAQRRILLPEPRQFRPLIWRQAVCVPSFRLSSSGQIPARTSSIIRWRGDTRADAVHGPPLLGHGVVDSRELPPVGRLQQVRRPGTRGRRRPCQLLSPSPALQVVDGRGRCGHPVCRCPAGWHVRCSRRCLPREATRWVRRELR